MGAAKKPSILNKIGTLVKVVALLITVSCLGIHYHSVAGGRRANLVLGGVYVAYTIIGSVVISGM